MSGIPENSESAIELGVITFAEMFPPGGNGQAPAVGERLHQVVGEARTAEAAGLAVYGVGEHHRQDFAAASPSVVLTAIAQHTNVIRLTSAATVLGCADPVRVFQDFATLDLLSGGRAEVVVGSGSFKEAPPLFGIDPDQVRNAFEENTRLLALIRKQPFVTWPQGHRRPAIDGLGVYPRPDKLLPVWVAAANSSATAHLAGQLGLPLVLGWFGQSLSKLKELASVHRAAAASSGYARPRLALQTHGYLSESTEQAIEEYFPAYGATIARLKPGDHLAREQYDRMCGSDGHLLIGTPARVAKKIEHLRVELGIDRVLLHISAGALPHQNVLGALIGLGKSQLLLRRCAPPQEFVPDCQSAKEFHVE